MLEAEAYRKGCDLADALKERGYPVVSHETIADMLILRFGAPRRQTLHAGIEGATLDGLIAAYERPPP